MRRLTVVKEQCTGCESCVLTCGFEHEAAFSLHRSRIRVNRDEEHADFEPMVCIQCDARACIAACSVAALSIDETTGAVRLSEETCIGCRECMSACPYGGVQFPQDAKTPLICDLCGGNPQCVEVCQLPLAIRFVEIE